jgi:hypothetical protein
VQSLRRHHESGRDQGTGARCTKSSATCLTFPGIFPDYSAPIVPNSPNGVRELRIARWDMPSSQFALMEATKKRAAKTRGKAVVFKELPGRLLLRQ